MEVGKKYVIIGGVATGPKVAARLRRLQPNAEITIIEENEYISYGGCGEIQLSLSNYKAYINEI